MGIPSYFLHIVRRHRNIIKRYNSLSTIDNLYLDSNSIIYDAVRNIDYNNNNIEFENKLCKLVCDKIIEYINMLNPQKCIFIAFDGVAPIAKLEQQRNRRYKSVFQKKITNRLFDPEPSWDTTAITPGTSFMDKLNTYVTNHFNNNKIITANKLSNLNIIISGSDKCGEGEHKIYQYIRDNISYHKNTTTAIYGLDADLIMLTLNHLHISDKLYLFRETPHFITHIDNTLNKNEVYLLDIRQLGDIISDELNNNTSSNLNRIHDYVLLCFFLGNDFMPHFPALNIRTNAIEYLIDAYKTLFSNTQKQLTNGQTIYWKNIKQLITYLADKEYQYLIEEYKIRNKWEARLSRTTLTKEKEDFDQQLQQIPLKDRRIEKYIDPYSSGWEKRYYKQLFAIDIDDKRRQEICTNYLEGLEWTIKYYTTGCANWRWHYKYDYAPLLADLEKYVPYFDVEFIKPSPVDPVHPYVQLSYVLPRDSLNLLPKSIQEYLLSNYSELYRLDCDFKWAFCKYFWESHVDLPYIDIKQLENNII